MASQHRQEAQLEFCSGKENQKTCPNHDIRCHHEDIVDRQKGILIFLAGLIDIDGSKSSNQSRNQRRQESQKESLDQNQNQT